MPRICFYISSHGFGHATREIEVINHLPERIEVEIVTAVPRWLFDHSVTRPFTYRELNHDSGIQQPNSFTQDLEGTYAHWMNLLDHYPQTAKAESQRFSSQSVNLVVGDISPFAAAVGAVTRVPSVIIANFSWNWIFQALLTQAPQFQKIMDRISDYYRQTSLLLRTPLSGDLSIFPKIQDIPIIARKSQKTREAARYALGIFPHEKTVLISLGGHGFAIPQSGLSQYPNITFITFNSELKTSANVRYVNPQTVYHPDLVRASDLAIAKLGYGMVTECIAHQVPIAYPPRDHFPEHEILEQEVNRYVPTFPMQFDDFLAGRWNFLDEFFHQPVDAHFVDKLDIPPIDGGEIAAQILTRLADNR